VSKGLQVAELGLFSQFNTHLSQLLQMTNGKTRIYFRYSTLAEPGFADWWFRAYCFTRANKFTIWYDQPSLKFRLIRPVRRFSARQRRYIKFINPDNRTPLSPFQVGEILIRDCLISQIMFDPACLQDTNAHQGQHKVHKVLLIRNINLVFFVHTSCPLW